MELSKMFQNNTFPINFTFPNYTCFNFRSHFVEWRSIYHFYFYQSSIFEIEQNFGSGPGKIMWCENLKIGIQNGKEKCTIMTGPLIDYPFTEGTLACVLSLCVRKYVTVRSYYVWIVPLWTIMVIAAVKMFLFLKFSSPRILELDLKWYSNSR